MDNLTHSLFALTLARTPLGRAGRGTTSALLLASNVPDIDSFTAFGGGVSYLTWHRGPTHGPLGVIGLGLLVAALVEAGRRLNPRWRAEPHDAPFTMLVGVSIVGGLFHVLMDFPTSYGTRLIAPFNWHWFTVDWMPIIDVYLLVALTAGLLFGRRSAEAGRRNAAIVLVLMATNYGLRGAAHYEALALAPRLFGPTLPQRCDPLPAQQWMLATWPRHPPSAPLGGRCLVEIAAIPTVSPFTWHIVAQMSNAYELHNLDLLDSRFRQSASDAEVFWRQVVRYPNIWTPEVEKAAATRLGRAFLGFSRFSAARSAVDSRGVTTVRFTDMRFVWGAIAIDQPLRRGSLFNAVVRLDAGGRVLSESLGQ